MIYEPEKLKSKKTMYKKRDRVLVIFIFLFWTVLLFVYINSVFSYVKSTVGFLCVIVGGMVSITMIYFLIAFFVLMHRGHQFRRMNNTIVREYHENKNGELFLEKLLAINKIPKDMNDEITWYLNIATAFHVLGRQNECIALFKQLEEVATGKDKEYIQNSIRIAQGQLEK